MWVLYAILQLTYWNNAYINGDKTLLFYILKVHHNNNLCEVTLMNLGNHLNIFWFLIYVKGITLTSGKLASESNGEEAMSDSLLSCVVIFGWKVMICWDYISHLIIFVKDDLEESNIICICAREWKLLALYLLLLFFVLVARWIQSRDFSMKDKLHWKLCDHWARGSGRSRCRHW